MIIAWLIGNPFNESLIRDYVNKHSNSGGWVYTQLFSMSNYKEIEKIVIVSVHSSYKEDSCFTYGKFEVYCIYDRPLKWHYDINTFRKIDKIFIDTLPDIVDVQGIEITLALYSKYNQINSPVINTIHGIAFQCYMAYYTGLPKRSLLLDRTIMDNLSLRGVFEAGLFMHKREKDEKTVLKSIKYIRGRTKWDEFCVKSINPDLKYYHVELILRDPFYSNKWDINNCKPNQIFIPQCHIPYKGLYFFIRALEIIKQTYNDIIVHVPGQIFQSGIKKNGFEKLILREIKNRNLQNNIDFIGTLNAQQMVQELLECRVFVLPSLIENSPNSLAEAQIVGVPCVSSMVGGTSDYIQDDVNGLLYNSIDPYMCAERVIRLMSNDSLSIRFSERARNDALKRHDKEKCTIDLMKTYKDIVSRGGEHE